MKEIASEKYINQDKKFQELLDILKEIIEEFYLEKRMITIRRLYHRAMTRCRKLYKRSTIEQAICLLIKEGIIKPQRFLVKEHILDNEKRKNIYNLIVNRFAISFSDIKKTFNYGNNIIAWNLKILIDFNFIKEINLKKRQIYASVSVLDEEAILCYLLFKKEELFDVVMLLANSEDYMVRKKDLFEHTKMSRNLLDYYIQFMVEKQILTKTKDAVDEYYILSRDLMPFIQRYVAQQK
ncbi:MAG: hypothetical protein ACTSU2_04290 [Promethearchaeota archaeon]